MPQAFHYCNLAKEKKMKKRCETVSKIKANMFKLQFIMCLNLNSTTDFATMYLPQELFKAFHMKFLLHKNLHSNILKHAVFKCYK